MAYIFAHASKSSMPADVRMFFTPSICFIRLLCLPSANIVYISFRYTSDILPRNNVISPFTLCRPFPHFLSSHIFILATTPFPHIFLISCYYRYAAVHLDPHTYPNPRSLPAVLPLLPPFPSRSGGHSGLVNTRYIFTLRDIVTSLRTHRYSSDHCSSTRRSTAGTRQEAALSFCCRLCKLSRGDLIWVGQRSAIQKGSKQCYAVVQGTYSGKVLQQQHRDCRCEVTEGGRRSHRATKLPA